MGVEIRVIFIILKCYVNFVEIIIGPYVVGYFDVEALELMTILKNYIFDVDEKMINLLSNGEVK